MWLCKILPEHHINSESKDTVKLGVGLVATATALLLGLVISSANSSFKDIDSQIKQLATTLLTLDRTLVRYGPESAGIRVELKDLLATRIAMIWPEHAVTPVLLNSSTAEKGEKVFGSLRHLSPQADDQRWLKEQAVTLGENLLQSRWLILSDAHIVVPKPLIAILIIWLTIIFTSFGLFAPRNLTVVATLFVCALSVSTSIFLVIEMENPFSGLIKVSPEALQYAYLQMNQ
jgi:hypothetical protein